MNRFKVGDRVRYISSSYLFAPSGYALHDIEIKCEHGGRYFLFDRGKDVDGTNCACGKHTWVADAENLELISSRDTIASKTMNIKEKFALAFKSEPEKTFRKAGITNGDDFLTDDGQKIFLSYLLKEHGVKFKTEVVDQLLADEDK